MLRTHYFVITPEVHTDANVVALRQGWMRSVPDERLHFCVAAGSDSVHLDQPTMLLLPEVQRAAATPATRDAYFLNREITGRQREGMKEAYNSFLRTKVLAMVREMAVRASRNSAAAWALCMLLTTALTAAWDSHLTDIVMGEENAKKAKKASEEGATASSASRFCGSSSVRMRATKR